MVERQHRAASHIGAQSALHYNRVCVHILHSRPDVMLLCWSAACLQQHTFISRLAHVCCRICMRFGVRLQTRTYVRGGEQGNLVPLFWSIEQYLHLWRTRQLVRNSILTCLQTSRLDQINEFCLMDFILGNILVEREKILMEAQEISMASFNSNRKLAETCVFYLS